MTRPRAEAESLAEALAARGIEALIEPVLEIHYRSEPVPDLAGVQAILCTSANGVRALARVTGERSLPLFTVGEASAARARDEGFARVESAGGSSADLALLARERLRPDAGRLLHVAGSDVAGDLAGALRADGFAVDRAVLYEARPVARLGAASERALGEGNVDFALFFSPRTALIFVGLAERAGVAAAMRVVTAISISAAADAALGALRWRARQIAERPDQPGLLAALDRVLAGRRRA
ncbi:MAG TPA: uroporphyrinogen-III synthase [Stellaceae bacterium]|nr:uroporphyrinogen-III synthase [Stellaceae bacterium]